MDIATAVVNLLDEKFSKFLNNIIVSVSSKDLESKLVSKFPSSRLLENPTNESENEIKNFMASNGKKIVRITDPINIVEKLYIFDPSDYIVIIETEKASSVVNLFKENFYETIIVITKNKVKPILGLNLDQHRGFYLFTHNSTFTSLSGEAIKKLKTKGENLPVPNHQILKDGVVNRENDQIFMDYISQVFKILTNTELGEITNPQLMILRKAFTHLSFDVNMPTEKTGKYGNNYEFLEMIGDNAVSYGFVTYVIKRVKRIDQQVVNEYKTRYMSKEFQPKIAKALKFDKWLISIDVPPNAKIMEDIFESFIGAIHEIQNSKIFGLGVITVYNILDGIFKDVELVDPEFIKYGKSKTRFLQKYLKPFRLDINDSHFKEGYIEEFSADKLTITLHSNFYSVYPKIKYTPLYIGPIYEVKDDSLENAFNVILERMIESGYTIEYLEETKRNNEMNIFNSELKKKISEWKISHNATSLYFDKVFSNKFYTVLQLIAIINGLKTRIKSIKYSITMAQGDSKIMQANKEAEDSAKIRIIREL